MTKRKLLARGKVWPRLRRAGVIDGLSNEMALALGDQKIWDRWMAAGGIIEGDDSLQIFARYRQVRRILKVSGQSHSEWVLEQVAAYLGKAKPTLTRIRTLIGKVNEDDLITICAIGGFAPPKSRRPARTATIWEIVDLFEGADRERARATVRKAQEEGWSLPHELHNGRVLGLGPVLRWLGAVVLLRYVREGYRHTSAASSLTALEMADDLVAIRPDESPGAILRDAWRHVEETNRSMLARYMVRYALDLGSARKWVAEELGHDGGGEGQLPACELRTDEFKAAFKARRQAVSASKDRRAQALAEQKLSPMEMLARLKARIAQVKAIQDRAEAMLKLVQDDPSLLPLSFSVEVPIVEADGLRRGDDQQLVHLRLELPSDAILHAVRISACRFPPSARRRAQRRIASTMPPPTLWTLDDFLLIYEGVTPLTVGAQAIEPFFVDIFRWRLLEGKMPLPPAIAARRTELLNAASIPLTYASRSGVFAFDRKLRPVVRRLLGEDPNEGEVAVSILGVMHGLLYAQFAFELMISDGIRSGEILQVQLGEPFLEKRQGQRFIKVVPKGWQELAEHELTLGARKALKELASFSSERWFGMARGETTYPLPARSFNRAQCRPELGEGQYLFQNKYNALDGEDLNATMKMAFYGISSMDIHLFRFGKITRMAKAGMAENVQILLSNHTEGSKTLRHYDLNGNEAATTAAHAAAQAMPAQDNRP